MVSNQDINHSGQGERLWVAELHGFSISSFILLPFWLFGVPGSTLGFAQRAYRCIPMNLLMTWQAGLVGGHRTKKVSDQILLAYGSAFWSPRVQKAIVISQQEEVTSTSQQVERPVPDVREVKAIRGWGSKRVIEEKYPEFGNKAKWELHIILTLYWSIVQQALLRII